MRTYVFMVRAASTLQDVHPDQLRSLWTTADLVLEEILSLQTDTKKSETYQNVHVSFISAAASMLIQHFSLTLARSRLRICPWKAAGLFRAATHKHKNLICTSLHYAHMDMHYSTYGEGGEKRPNTSIMIEVRGLLPHSHPRCIRFSGGVMDD